MKAEFDVEIQPEAFQFNHTISIEGSICEYHNKDNSDVRNHEKIKMYLPSHFSDESAQNTTATFQHMQKLIHWTYENSLFIKNDIIYDTID